VLVVDIQLPVIELISGVLQMFNVQKIHYSDDGIKALNIFRETSPDLLIVDWELFNSNGVDFTKLIRSSPENPFVPIIFMTAFTSKQRVTRARDSGITEFLAKPFTADSLYKRLENIVEKPRQFVFTPDYRGPDRRRKHDKSYQGIERRNRKELDLTTTETDVFKTQKKYRDAKSVTIMRQKIAEFVTPPNIMRQKIGSGGIDTTAFAMAKNFLDNNTIDFMPIGLKLVNALAEGLRDSKKEGVASKAAI